MTKIVNLHFKGPLAIKDYYEVDLLNRSVKIKGSIENPEISRNTLGFYVWGHLHFGKFVPYYVGEIHSTGILERIREHIKSIIKIDSTLTRLSRDYFYGSDSVIPYYKDDLFQKGSPYASRTKLPNWVAAEFDYFRDRIDYLNNEDFLKKAKGVTEPTFIKSIGYPISNLTIDDQLISALDDMQFIFSEHTDNIHLFEKIEGYIKYCLNGKTFGFSDHLTTVMYRLRREDVDIRISCQENLSYIFKAGPSETEFPGY